MLETVKKIRQGIYRACALVWGGVLIMQCLNVLSF